MRAAASTALLFSAPEPPCGTACDAGDAAKWPGVDAAVLRSLWSAAKGCCCCCPLSEASSTRWCGLLASGMLRRRGRQGARRRDVLLAEGRRL